ncbi:transposase [Geobacillus subterraneus]|uniref:transposase n=1 Tax=Geobacillus subterraneus TaxID=129338 RepID=UPI004059C400
MQKLVSDEEIQRIAEAVGYRDSSRTFTLRKLIYFFLLAAMPQWKSFRHGADVGPLYGLPTFHYSTVSKKAKEVPYDIMKRLLALIVSKCSRQTRRSLRVVDSTTVTVGKNRLPWAPYHGERAGVKLHIAYSPESSLPADVMETTGLRHDGPVGEPLTNAQQVLVEDQAYVKIERLDRFVEQHQLFVIRMKDNIELHQKNLETPFQHILIGSSRLHVPVGDETMPIDQASPGIDLSRCKATRHSGRDEPLPCVCGNHCRHVPTTLDRVEVFFRWVKPYLNVPTLCGTTENVVYNQRFAVFMVYGLL